jgi:hypothetical protein
MATLLLWENIQVVNFREPALLVEQEPATEILARIFHRNLPPSAARGKPKMAQARPTRLKIACVPF